jgi:carbonic anhydrase/acetyltransferase-like protein (isoleucine patch superfamily)
MIKAFNGIDPKIHDSCFIAKTASIIGDVKIKKDANIWYGVVLRGDGDPMIIGEATNIQDNTVVHVDHDQGTMIGNNVTIGHSAVIHSCTIKDNVLVGMGSIVLTNAIIHENVIIGAGALVPPNKELKSNGLYMGSPVEFIRELTDEEIKKIKKSSKNYVTLANKY